MPVYSILNSSLFWFHRLAGEEEFCPRMNHISRLSYTQLRYLDKNLLLELMVEWVKSFGAVGMGEYILHKRRTYILRDQRVICIGPNSFTSKFIC